MLLGKGHSLYRNIICLAEDRLCRLHLGGNSSTARGLLPHLCLGTFLAQLLTEIKSVTENGAIIDRRNYMMNSEKPYDVITMGRSCIDLYSNDVGAPFVDISSFASYVEWVALNQHCCWDKPVGFKYCFIDGCW